MVEISFSLVQQALTGWNGEKAFAMCKRRRSLIPSLTVMGGALFLRACLGVRPVVVFPSSLTRSSHDSVALRAHMTDHNSAVAWQSKEHPCDGDGQRDGSYLLHSPLRRLVLKRGTSYSSEMRGREKVDFLREFVETLLKILRDSDGDAACQSFVLNDVLPGCVWHFHGSIDPDDFEMFCLWYEEEENKFKDHRAPVVNKGISRNVTGSDLMSNVDEQGKAISRRTEDAHAQCEQVVEVPPLSKAMNNFKSVSTGMRSLITKEINCWLDQLPGWNAHLRMGGPYGPDDSLRSLEIDVPCARGVKYRSFTRKTAPERLQSFDDNFLAYLRSQYHLLTEWKSDDSENLLLPQHKKAWAFEDFSIHLTYFIERTWDIQISVEQGPWETITGRPASDFNLQLPSSFTMKRPDDYSLAELTTLYLRLEQQQICDNKSPLQFSDHLHLQK
ncbi:hypothetical protein BKA93DRAFT_865772 [Sparassis latifolia]